MTFSRNGDLRRRLKANVARAPKFPERRHDRSVLDDAARIADSVTSRTEAVIAFERKMAKPNKCYAHRAILVRTMAQAALVDEQGMDVEVTVGFAMSRPS